MSRIVELKNMEDSIVSPEYGLAKDDIAMLLSQENKSDSVYELTIETPTRRFEPFQDRTNDNTNKPVIISSRYEGKYTVVYVDEKELKVFSFSEPFNTPIPWIGFRPLGGELGTTWINNSVETIIFPRIQRGSRSIMDRLRKFADLEPGWDSYDAAPIEWETITRAMRFFWKVLYEAGNKDIPLPFVAPLSDGGIQFEWKTCYKELILSIPKNEQEPLQYLKVDKLLWEEREQEDIVPSIDEMVNIVKDWLL